MQRCCFPPSLRSANWLPKSRQIAMQRKSIMVSFCCSIGRLSLYHNMVMSRKEDGADSSQGRRQGEILISPAVVAIPRNVLVMARWRFLGLMSVHTPVARRLCPGRAFRAAVATAASWTVAHIPGSILSVATAGVGLIAAARLRSPGMTTGSYRDRVSLDNTTGRKAVRVHAIIGREVGADFIGCRCCSLLCQELRLIWMVFPRLILSVVDSHYAGVARSGDRHLIKRIWPAASLTYACRGC